MKTFAAAIALAAASALPAAPLLAQDAAETPATPDWVDTSNAYTQKAIALQASFFPTGASSAGYEQYDGLVNDMSLDRDERYVAASRALIAEYEGAKQVETLSTGRILQGSRRKACAPRSGSSRRTASSSTTPSVIISPMAARMRAKTR